MSYKLKLIQFNSTKKYLAELDFLYSLMNINNKSLVLDYGCGIGTSVERLISIGVNAFGYDKYNFVDGNPHWYIKEINIKYSDIYFMHSLAHIDDIDSILLKCKDMLQESGSITVITPNLDWLNLMANNNYKPDTTVIKHYNISELKDLFVNLGFNIVQIGQFGDIKGNVNERLFIKVSK